MRREKVATCAANCHGARAEPVDFLASLPDLAYALTWDGRWRLNGMRFVDARVPPSSPFAERGFRTSGVAHVIPALTVADMRVAIAESREEIDAAHHLVRRRYAWRGYEVEMPSRDPQSAGVNETSPHEITFVAANRDVTIGTCTLGLDGPLGLRADGTHSDVIQKVREAGRRVCEITRLAVADSVDSKSVLASLFNLAYLAGKTIHGVTDVFIEVNPRHVVFYSRVLGFVVAAGETFCERVCAPSVLLHVEADALAARLVALAGRALPQPMFAHAA